MITGLYYEMSSLIPPQFDKYGTTFWIPAQVEPAVALIGTSLPAIRHFFVTTARQMSLSLLSGSTSSAKQGSNNSNSNLKQSRRALNLRWLNGEDVALRSEYFELDDN